MPKRAQEQTRTGATENQADEATSAASGDNVAAQQGNTEGETSEKTGKKRVKCEALKGKKIIIGKGEAVQIDENGFFEVEAEEAERLLTIPGYKKA
jgi:hypothetical protein